MRTTTIKARESIFDVAIRECEAVEAAFPLASRMGLSVTDELAPGTEIEIPAADVVKKQVVDVFASHGIHPATELSAADLTAAPCGGIGAMGIEIDFKVR